LQSNLLINNTNRKKIVFDAHKTIEIDKTILLTWKLFRDEIATDLAELAGSLGRQKGAA
jgi:hypothetical protein